MNLFAFLILSISIASISNGAASAAASSGSRVRDAIQSLEKCMMQSVFSFIYPESYPPTTTAALKNSCKQQAEGFKCVKERGKATPPLVKRGTLSFVQNRQRYHRKYCTNTESELSKQFVKDMKCIMEKRLPVYQEIDAIMANSAIEIIKRNYNNSATELNYLCCSIINYKKNIIDGVGSECQSAKAQVEEMISSTISSELNIICEDEDKLLTKICPKLEPMNVSKTIPTGNGTNPSTTILYLIATLGEPEEAGR